MALVKASTVRKKAMYRHTFDIRYAGLGSIHLHTLLVNPEDLSMEEPARNVVTQTLGGAYVTDFGSGLPTVVLSGTTGYKTRTSAEGRELDGFEAFVDLRKQIYRRFIESNDPNLSLNWYNWEDDEYYEIQPQHFRLQRNKAEPLLYRYEFRFTCLRPLKDARRTNRYDYLMIEPSTRDVQLKIDSATSAVSEFINAVFGER